MAVMNNDQKRCRQCPEVNHHEFGGFVYCAWLNQDVFAESIMCPHGRDLLECF